MVGRPPGKVGRPRKTPEPAEPVQPPAEKEPEVDIVENGPAEFVRWRKVDDALLISGMQQVGNIVALYQATKFSRPYALREVKERWKALLLNKELSSVAAKDVAQAAKDSHFMMLNEVLWSPEEDEALKQLREEGKPGLADFEKLRIENLHVFHPSRTARKMSDQWRLMQHYGLLEKIVPAGKKRRLRPDSISEGTAAAAVDAPAAPEVSRAVPAEKPTFEDMEEAMVGKALEFVKAPSTQPDEAELSYRQELLRSDRADKRKIRKLEEEAASWAWCTSPPPVIMPVAHPAPANTLHPRPAHQPQPAHATGNGSSAGKVDSYGFDMSVLAVLRGTRIRYQMRTREIVLGRSGCDVNLRDEGPANKISRRQGVIKMKSDTEFYLRNLGQRPFYVNGQPVRQSQRVRLNHASVIEISELKFVFNVNVVLQKKLKTL